jgi:Spy/CpxP family protein refolding chaperone
MVVWMILAGLLAGASAGEGKRRSPRDHRDFDEELNLTEEQKAELKKLHQGVHEGLKEFKKKMRELRATLKDELSKDTPDKAALETYAASMGDLAKQMAAHRVEHLLQVKEVLTAEQFAALLSKEPMLRGGHRPRACKGDSARKERAENKAEE